MEKDALFILASPFQCLCALEAINHFKIDDPQFIISGDSSSIKMIKELLSSKSYNYKEFYPRNFILNIYNLLKSKHNNFGRIYIGNFESTVFITIAALYAKRHAQFYFLDDGIQSLERFSPNYVSKHRNIKLYAQTVINETLCRLKFIPKPIFYTIYDVITDEFTIIRNKLSLYKVANDSISKHGVFIIGTNSSVVGFVNYSYTEYLTALIDYIRQKYSSETIFYCPHRRDIDNEDVNSLCKNKGVSIFMTKVSVEYDFIINRIVPLAVYGFTSNALYTLKMLFPYTDISTIMYHVKDLVADRNTQTIRDNLQKYKVNTLTVLQ